MEPETTNQLISAASGLIGACIGATVTVTVARFTSKRQAETERRKETRARGVAAAEQYAVDFEYLEAALRAHINAVTNDRSKFSKTQRAYAQASSKTAATLLRVPNELRERLTLPHRLVINALDLGTLDDKNGGYHYDHPLTILNSAAIYTWAALGAFLHDEPMPPLSLNRQLAEYRASLSDMD